MISRRILISTVGVFLLSSAACKSEVERFTPQSHLIFTGTSLVLNSSTFDIEDVSGLAIVRVDEVISSADVFRNLAGELVTVRLEDPSKIQVGQQRVFFTRSWHFGESIGLHEVGSVAAPDARGWAQMLEEIPRVQEQQSDRELVQLLDSAEMVVRGRVVEVRRADIPRTASEHDPDWREADIRIERVLKGDSRQNTITILFPASEDVMWYRAPHFQPGMEGILLLKRTEFAGRPLEHLTALNPAQFRPLEEEERITRLLGGQ